MYAGHFAVALALKAVRPAAPAWALAAGTGLLDLVFGGLVAAGVEGFAPDFARSHLLVIPWSHSLLGAVVLAAGFVLCFRGRGGGVMLAIAAAVLSHWLLDLLVHRPDLPLWPCGTLRLGGFAWFGPVSGWAETVLTVTGAGLYAGAARRATDFGRFWPANVALLGLFWLMGLSAG